MADYHHYPCIPIPFVVHSGSVYPCAHGVDTQASDRFTHFTKPGNLVAIEEKVIVEGVLLYDGAYDMQTLRATGAPGTGLFLWSYTGVRHFETYIRIDELSAAKHVTPGYPLVFLAVGDADPLESQSIEFMKVLEKNRVGVDAVLLTINASLVFGWKQKRFH